MEIEDYGIIGNLQTTALVSKRDASIDFFCFPFCDSPTVFARLLDIKRGGYFRIRPVNGDYTSKQLYLPSSNVLQTRFSLQDGIAQVTDLMPVYAQDAGRLEIKPWLVRRVDVVRGCMQLEVDCEPAFKYGLEGHETVTIDSDTLIFRSKYQSLRLKRLHQNMKLGPLASKSTIQLCETDSVIFILTDANEEDDGKLEFDSMQQIITKTNHFWHDWIGKSIYKGRWREMVHRSALALKLLTFHPTGAIIAAPTFSLPEEIGGSLNWDYRFTWIRDAAFTVYGFLRIGLKEEAQAFMEWIQHRCESLNGSELKILYDVNGKVLRFDPASLQESNNAIPSESNGKNLHEVILSHWEGFQGSSPVRVGNGAAEQTQIDIYGELMDAIYLCDKYCKPVSFDFWRVIKANLVTPILSSWTQPDHGIWEIRGERRHYVYSKVMCWVGLDRAIRLALKHSLPAPLQEWQSVRDSIREQVMREGWSEERQSFVQFYGSSQLDAANLIMPLVFFISPADPLFLKTLAATCKSVKDGGLSVNHLVFRYNVHSLQADTEMFGNDGTFSMCTFWLSEALALAGKYEENAGLLEESILLFEDMIGYANHLGLFSEEISLAGRAVGNFPQALTHLSLISAAFNIDRILETKSKK